MGRTPILPVVSYRTTCDTYNCNESIICTLDMLEDYGWAIMLETMLIDFDEEWRDNVSYYCPDHKDSEIKDRQKKIGEFNRLISFECGDIFESKVSSTKSLKDLKLR